jgi:hypothetical protein
MIPLKSSEASAFAVALVSPLLVFITFGLFAPRQLCFIVQRLPGLIAAFHLAITNDGQSGRAGELGAGGDRAPPALDLAETRLGHR